MKIDMKIHVTGPAQVHPKSRVHLSNDPCYLEAPSRMLFKSKMFEMWLKCGRLHWLDALRQGAIMRSSARQPRQFCFPNSIVSRWKLLISKVMSVDDEGVRAVCI